MKRGFNLLHHEKFSEAIDLGRDLEAQRFSGGFEIQATGLNGLGRRDEAIKVLERGVTIVPDVWLLWQLLGNYRSDEKNYEDAFEAYEKAEACEGDDPVSIAYNYANALLRADRPADAKIKLQPIIDTGIPQATEPELRDLIIELYDALGSTEDACEPKSFVHKVARLFGLSRD